MIPHCLEYAEQAKSEGRPIVGIMCEYTPRELIMAAGGVPVCLCGGSLDTITAAEEELPANLCPLIKSTYGYHLQGSNPFLEMADLIVAETTCDGKKKMSELLARSRDVYVLELPQKPNEPQAMEHWRTELARFREFLEQRFDVEITDERLRDAIAAMNRERVLRRELALLMRSDPPPMTGLQLLKLKSNIACIEDDLSAYESILEDYFEKTSGKKESAPSKNTNQERAVRVMMTGVPMVHGAEHVLEIVESSGGVCVAMENCTGLKPILEDVPVYPCGRYDPMQAIAEKYFHLPCSVMTPNDRRLETIRELVEVFRPECIVDLIWQACLTYDVESARVAALARELKLPYLRIETDYSRSDAARIGVRVEALMETVRSGKEIDPSISVSPSIGTAGSCGGGPPSCGSCGE
jgi:benzoyl-CoA reductase/2-hydroxyglutaryl-CoA dehydratase subunit BcrC/BadD/HgdB